MSRLVDLNRGPFVGAPSEVSELAAPPADAVILDVRDANAYGEGHCLGALNVPVSGSSFATKAGFVLDVDDRIVVQASSAAEAGDAIRGLRAVGFLELEGYVLGGGSERIEPVDLDELARLLEEGVELIDVRERDKHDDGYIAGSRNIPYRLLPICGADVPTDRPVVTICRAAPAPASPPRSWLRKASPPARCSTAGSRTGPPGAGRWSSSAAAVRERERIALCF